MEHEEGEGEKRKEWEVEREEWQEERERNRVIFERLHFFARAWALIHIPVWIRPSIETKEA